MTHALSDYAGQMVLLIFSRPSWCPPCKFEAPVLQELWNTFSKVACQPRTQFLMISVNETEQSYKTAVQSFGITFPALFDTGGIITNLYGVQAVPTLFIIDTEQKICNTHVGASPPADALADEIHGLLTSCGACDKTVMDFTHMIAAVKILFGVTQDGGGVVISPSGHPIPIDPWGPLQKISPEKKNVLINLAIAEMTKSLNDAKTAATIEMAALRSVTASVNKLVAMASEVPTELADTFSVVPRKK